MKVAVVGSRNLTINNLGDYLPKATRNSQRRCERN